MTKHGGARECVLVFAGSDPSAGAGIAADVQAVTAVGAHPLAVVTALTVQDHNRVYEVMPVAPELVLRQARALTAACRIDAVKIGIPGSADNARTIAQVIAELRLEDGTLPVVLDPVLASGHGDRLGRGDAVAALAPLLALATVVTPNGPEAAALGLLESDRALVTGGHDEGGEVVNRWCGRSWTWPRLPGSFHGSGCTLAAALAGLLAQGWPMSEALERAQAYTHATLAAAYRIGAGQHIPLR
ncbi:hydroxymethylpyrimidine/phosphomethylpyrimidine kinase [Pseudoduganella plicata]|uniref:hydroxymethylpyrimidine kinase n=1 Tax=Pseudoduganella plicata TaxID=321984 RepID=A0A4P7BJ58_9BURK|nr:hydroxymethylpyrimidine/phosphomethylpyrimidine kinase [Pseudoduganella plicata]QBQ38282.1 hydroxymethylpyrimidine/phosphomethylpyrimidine kinase [Pseudoduganella plicata]GGY80827.1 hydroxymethylpyrimidine/phosphomethylpyrimidine kinase [Pseudoduganella plicata]